MTAKEAVNWIINIMADIGKSEHRALWHYEQALMEIREMLETSAQPEIILCRDCKHRPKATRADEKVFSGFSVEFTDEKCPCQCGDGWYNWYPDDDFYCGYAERREDGSD